jgi:hypothetical protein
LQLPARCGGLRLAEIAKAQLAKRPQRDTAYALAETIRANGTADEISAYWRNIRAKLEDDELWLNIGMVMGSVAPLSTSECVSLVSEIGKDAGKLMFLLGRGDVFDAIPGLAKDVFAQLLESPERYYYGLGGPTEEESRGREIIYLMNWAYSLLSAVSFRELDEFPEHLPLREVVRPFQFESHASVKNLRRISDDNWPMPRQFFGVLNQVLGVELRVWKSQLDPWSAVIEPAREIWGEKIIFWLTAIHAAAVVNSPIGREYHLIDERESLCNRAAYAKQRSDDVEWWCEQLASASGTGMSAVQSVVLVMHQFAPMDLILSLSDEISGALDRLPALAWHQLARACSALEAPIISVGTLGFPSSTSPRLAALLVDRLSPDDGMVIYERYLAGYNANDTSVLQKCANLALQGLCKPGMRAQSLQVVSNIYNQDICPRISPRHLHLEKEDRMPIDAARSVCSNPMDFPLSLIAKAETVLTTQAGSQSIPVGQVAERDKWFSD